jgi:hypothetical protein
MQRLQRYDGVLLPIEGLVNHTEASTTETPLNYIPISPSKVFPAGPVHIVQVPLRARSPLDRLQVPGAQNTPIGKPIQGFAPLLIHTDHAVRF